MAIRRGERKVKVSGSGLHLRHFQPGVLQVRMKTSLNKFAKPLSLTENVCVCAENREYLKEKSEEVRI